MHLRDHLKIIKKRRKTIVLVFLLVFAVIALATFTATPMYEGTTKVVIDKVEQSRLTGGYRSMPQDPEFYETQFQLIKSRAVALRIVELLDLAENYDRLSGAPEEGAAAGATWVSNAKEALKRWITVLRGKEPTSEEEAGDSHELLPTKAEMVAEKISRGIRVEPVGGSRMVNIRFLSANPEFAPMVANATVKAYVEETLNMKMEASRRTLDWMTKKAAAERTKVERAEKKLQEYMDANDILTMENRRTVTPEQLTELSTQLLRAETKRKELEALYRKVRGVSSAETVSAIADDATLRSLRAQIVAAEQLVMELSGKYGQKHPVMTKAQNDLQVLRQKKDQEVNRIVESIRNEYDLARSLEAGLRAQLEATKAGAIKLNEKYVRYNTLQREVDTNRQLFDALMLKIKEQGITEENQPVNVWIVAEAQIPKAPAKPNKLLNLLLGLVVATMGGLGAAFFIEYLDTSIKTVEDTEAMLGVPVLGSISLIGPRDGEVGTQVLGRPLSAFAEGFKALRTSILLSSAERPPKKVLISSALPEEGKTSVAANLALAMAQSSQRVLLIDGDLRKPRLHKVFSLKNQKGLSTYLAGASTMDCLQAGPLPNLAIMTSGPIPPNPSELLFSNRFKNLLDVAGERFDFIVCDSPPVLALADARNLGRVFDGTILVTRAQKTTYDVAGKALKLLQTVNANVLGLVINALVEKEVESYCSAYYGEGQRQDLAQPAVARDGAKAQS